VFSSPDFSSPAFSVPPLKPSQDIFVQHFQGKRLGLTLNTSFFFTLLPGYKRNLLEKFQNGAPTWLHFFPA